MADTAIDVLIGEDVWGEPFEALAGTWRVHRSPELWRDRERFTADCAKARALVVRNRSDVNARLLEACPQLRIVARAGVGLDNIDLAAADRGGVVVSAPIGANATSVAEHTVGLALALARDTAALNAATKAGAWQREPGFELHGGTWGLLGAGATARPCAALARALGMRVLAYDPYIAPEHPTLEGLTLTGLHEVAANADVLSCHLPATGRTVGIVDAELLAAMRPHALLINVGRGECVDERALAEALAVGSIGGAALDVRASEPPEPGALEAAPNVLLTPHIAGITAQSQERIARVLAEDIDAVLRGEPARAAVGAHR